MVANCLEQQLPIDAVKIALDVNIEHPVEPPAALSGLLEGVDRRSAGAVSIGVIVEDGFQDGLQIPFDDFLCDSVADRWDTQRPGPSIALGKVNPPHWRRKVAPRGHPIPEPVEVVRKINLKLAIVCPSTPAAPWLAFTFLKASQTSRFGMLNGFALATELLPLPVGSGSQLNNAAPSIQLHYRAFHSTTSCSAPVPRIGTLILAVLATRTSPFASGRQVLTFHTRA
jgi:hypothetical protein